MEYSEEILQESLQLCLDQLGKIELQFKQTGIRLQEDLNQGLKNLKATLILWRDILKVLALSEGLIGIDYSQTSIDGRTVYSANSELKNLIGKIKEAMGTRDRVALIDYLEYEISDHLNFQKRTLEFLADRLQSKLAVKP